MDLKKYVINGFKWTAIQTVATKIISVFTQILLAWLLLPEDFGKVAIANSIVSIIFLFQALGISDVLVSRGSSFKIIYDLAKSIVLVASSVCFFISVLIAFISGNYIYNDSDITNLILIFSFAIPFNAMSVVADADLRINLRFKDLTFIRVTEFLLTNFMIISLVILKFGIYSFVIAPLISSIYRYFLIHKISENNHSFKFSLNHYKYLLGNSLLGFIHNICQSIIRQLDYLIIGFFLSAQAVGLYFMGYSLSVQVISLLVSSITPVFFPVLKKIPKNKIKDLGRIFIQIIYTFSIFGMGFSFFQASVAEPLMKLILNETWLDSIIIVEILSLGIGFNITCSVWALSFRLRDDYKGQALYSIASLIIFFLFISFGTYKYGIRGTAVLATLFNIIFNLFLLYSGLKHFKITFAKIFIITFKYFLFSVIIFSFPYILLGDIIINNYLTLIFNSLIPLFIYFGFIYFFDSHGRPVIVNVFKVLKDKFKYA